MEVGDTLIHGSEKVFLTKIIKGVPAGNRTIFFKINYYQTKTRGGITILDRVEYFKYTRMVLTEKIKWNQEIQ